ncbi:zinc ribbon domain-containing protein [Chimaeribacter arupi]|uniref:zinc ribbon domain-containing protein n=1 Tax=Chimaeribacter arupi TaxID=2060066 RepID=UPI000C7E57A6|nr:zinc ribbon domain-containing protein [Chimaeribacter arupi]PLR48623.1 zinc ribbon domain-containing protein [Chimaeribacter arupi]
MEFILVAAVLGIIPALIAQSKGRSFVAWWFYGFLLFIIALVHSIVIKKDNKVIEQEMIDDGMKKCPFCAELVRKEAVKCKHCGSDISGNSHSASNVKTDEEYLEEARKKAGLL